VLEGPRYYVSPETQASVRYKCSQPTLLQVEKFKYLGWYCINKWRKTEQGDW